MRLMTFQTGTGVRTSISGLVAIQANGGRFLELMRLMAATASPV